MSDRMTKVLALRAAGCTYQQTADAMGISANAVKKAVTRAREYGYIPPKRASNIQYLMRNARVTVGRTRVKLAELPPDVLDWLIELTPEGGTLSETLTELAEDAYLDNLEKLKERENAK